MSWSNWSLRFRVFAWWFWDVAWCYVQVCHPWREHPPDRARRGATSSWSRSASRTRRNTRQEPRPMEQTVRRKLWKMWWYVVKLWSVVKCSEVKWPDHSTWTKTICVYIYIYTYMCVCTIGVWFGSKHHGRKFESISVWFLLAKNGNKARSVWCFTPDSLKDKKCAICWSFALEHVDCFCPQVLTWKSRPRPQRIPKAESGLDVCETWRKEIASVLKASKGF